MCRGTSVFHIFIQNITFFLKDISHSFGRFHIRQDQYFMTKPHSTVSIHRHAFKCPKRIEIDNTFHLSQSAHHPLQSLKMLTNKMKISMSAIFNLFYIKGNETPENKTKAKRYLKSKIKFLKNPPEHSSIQENRL